jgi:hypothetical protein
MNCVEEFAKLANFYKENEFEKIFRHSLGTYFLKIRSLNRTKILLELGALLSLNTENIPRKKLTERIFCSDVQVDVLDAFIKRAYDVERAERIQSEDYLYSQLYKLKVFDWGGFHQNAVEKSVVDNYIKKIRDYDELCFSIENDINPRFREYILSSWYNLWSSILIEDMIKDHPDVLPTIGKVKKVDFFWNDFPFDLKVTYFPKTFMQLKRKEMGLDQEIKELKRFAKKNNIYFNSDSKEDEIFQELLTKISEDTSTEATEFVRGFRATRTTIVADTLKHPKALIKWFYEQQGVRRFDSANRFFIVLVDCDHLEDSWKLKRNKKLLLAHINNFFDNNKNPDFKKLQLSFSWEEKTYNTYATVLFILKN